MRKQMAEDVRNVFTTIIELRTSCQMVWTSIIKVEQKRIAETTQSQSDSSLNFIRMSDGRGGKISLAQTDYSELENVVYFTSKCNSLVEILDEHLKERDRQVFQKVKERVCTELKKQMEIAIDRYN